MYGLVSGNRLSSALNQCQLCRECPDRLFSQWCPKFPTEISRGPRFEMQIKEQGAERARRTLVRRSERSDAVTQRCGAPKFPTEISRGH